MGDDLKKMYRTVMDDHFPPEIKISFGDQVLVYRKKAWTIPDDKTDLKALDLPDEIRLALPDVMKEEQPYPRMLSIYSDDYIQEFKELQQAK